MKGYIYKYTFPNGKVYIGQTQRTIDKRHKQHMCHSKYHDNRTVCEQAIAKYGEPFVEILETICVDYNEERNFRDDMNKAEKKWIKHFDSENPKIGYNSPRGGMRDGAGRKKGVDTHRFLLNVEQTLFEALKDKPNKTQYINDAIREKLTRD